MAPDLALTIVDTVIHAMGAEQSSSQQVLGSKQAHEGLKDILLRPGQLYEPLRERFVADQVGAAES